MILKITTFTVKTESAQWTFTSSNDCTFECGTSHFLTISIKCFTRSLNSISFSEDDILKSVLAELKHGRTAFSCGHKILVTGMTVVVQPVQTRDTMFDLPSKGMNLRTHWAERATHMNQCRLASLLHYSALILEFFKHFPNHIWSVHWDFGQDMWFWTLKRSLSVFHRSFEQICP